MQIRCTTCTKTIAIAPTGALPPACPHCAGAAVPPQLGPYVPLRLVATGGMGEVYLARHAELGTEVALKLLPALPLDMLSAVRERFAREARLTAKVRHAGVVKVLASDAAGDRPFLVLEFVAGETLRQRIERGPLPVADAARIAAATADVLAAAHAEGVLHRDIKPDNVMVERDGAIRVLDFGIARAVQDDAPITRTGEIVGTPEYMAPEQLLDGPDAITERTDVHALGVLAYELLTGRSPFHGANVFQALKLVESLVPPPPSRARPGVPPALDAIVAQALAKQPQDRIASARAFADAVRAAVPEARDAAAAARPPMPPVVRFLWGALAVVVLALVTSAWLIAHALPDAAAALGNAAGRVLNEGVRAATVAATADDLLREGQWNEVLALSTRADGTDTPALLAAAQQAFVCAHVAWPLAVGAPAWLGDTDNRQCARWLGDGNEAPVNPAREDWNQAVFRLSFFANAQRARLLAQHLGAGEAAAPPNSDPALADDALARLVRIRDLPAAERADAFAAYAQRLPLESCEHWLALTCERHLRGDRAGGTQAAEMAWLSGAGELAVLLDAYLQVAPLPGDSAWRELDGHQLERTRKRIAGGDAADTPARALLLAFFDALHHLELDTAPLRTVPRPLAAGARPWFVANAAGPADHAVPMLLIAAALGAVPDYAQAPWSDVPTALRGPIDAEAKRGR